MKTEVLKVSISFLLLEAKSDWLNLTKYTILHSTVPIINMLMYNEDATNSYTDGVIKVCVLSVIILTQIPLTA